MMKSWLFGDGDLSIQSDIGLPLSAFKSVSVYDLSGCGILQSTGTFTPELPSYLQPAVCGSGRQSVAVPVEETFEILPAMYSTANNWPLGLNARRMGSPARWSP
jgi:hypothetical protein